MTTKTLHVKGMMCAHCVAHVQKALEALGAQTEVRLDEGVAIVKMPTPIAEETLRQAVADAGYEVTGID